MTRPRAISAAVAAVASALLGILTLLVAGERTQELDDAAKELFRPNDMWSTPQYITGNVIDPLRPLHVLGATLLFTIWWCWRRRSWRALALLVSMVGVVSVSTNAIKHWLDRPDTHHWAGGSYPSGHTSMLIVVLGFLLMIVPRIRPWMWISALALVAAMTVSLLVIATHWLTDIVAGALLGVAVVSGAFAVVGRSCAERPSRCGTNNQRTRVEPPS